MFALGENHRFFLFGKPTDMRKSFDTLAGLIRSGMQRNPTSGDVYIFINKRRNMMKVLNWQKGGFMLYFKRLEKGKFYLPDSNKNTAETEISHARLAMISEGIIARNIIKKSRFSKTENMI